MALSRTVHHVIVAARSGRCFLYALKNDNRDSRRATYRFIFHLQHVPSKTGFSFGFLGD